MLDCSQTEALSPAAQFAALPRDTREARLRRLKPVDCQRLLYDWSWWARPAQQIPAGSWIDWVILAGRGWGKTRTGAETIRQWARSHDHVNLIGATADDARDIMIEGESGILAVCPPHERPAYEPSKRRLTWPNGARSLIFTADEPERLRGKQHAKLWCDELASWRYPESWEQARFGLRLGSCPQTVITTTPRPTKLVKDLVAASTSFVTRGVSVENKQNLAPSFFARIVEKYQGTRLGRQELGGEILDDNPNALWTRAMIEAQRVDVAPPLRRIVVAIDPSASSNAESDECGIMACGIDAQEPAHFYVLEDASLIATPDGWARRSVKAYHDHTADRIVAETNNGGEMVEAVIRNVDTSVSYKCVTATRGKMVRAEPIAALYEQGRVHHVGTFPQLEDQMCQWDPTIGDSPDRMDANVWALTELSARGDMGLLNFYRDEVIAMRAKGVA